MSQAIESLIFYAAAEVLGTISHETTPHTQIHGRLYANRSLAEVRIRNRNPNTYPQKTMVEVRFPATPQNKLWYQFTDCMDSFELQEETQTTTRQPPTLVNQKYREVNY